MTETKELKCYNNKKCKWYNCTIGNNCENYRHVINCENLKRRKIKSKEPQYYKCDLLMELFKSAEQTNRNYWIMTELFVKLHGGKDYCQTARNYYDKKNKEEQKG